MTKENASILEPIRDFVRLLIRQLAKILNKISGGKISPNQITIIGLFAHIIIALLIAKNYYTLSAILLIIFGLFDTLDGELARLQGSSSTKGMLLDSVTDRFKEVFLYAGAAYSLVNIGQPYLAVWAVLACGASLSVSYVRAKGESATLAKEGHGTSQINKVFKDGLMRFEIRMIVLILGLLTHYLGASIVIIAILSAITAFNRLLMVIKRVDV